MNQLDSLFPFVESILGFSGVNVMHKYNVATDFNEEIWYSTYDYSLDLFFNPLNKYDLAYELNYSILPHNLLYYVVYSCFYWFYDFFISDHLSITFYYIRLIKICFVFLLFFCIFIYIKLFNTRLANAVKKISNNYHYVLYNSLIEPVIVKAHHIQLKKIKTRRNKKTKFKNFTIKANINKNIFFLSSGVDNLKLFYQYNIKLRKHYMFQYINFKNFFKIWS